MTPHFMPNEGQTRAFPCGMRLREPAKAPSSSKSPSEIFDLPPQILRLASERWSSPTISSEARCDNQARRESDQ